MRRTLPQRRAAETFTVVCRNQPVTITAGFYDDGTLGEVFITTAKSGADLQNIANDAAVILEPRASASRQHRGHPARSDKMQRRLAGLDPGRGGRLPVCK